MGPDLNVAEGPLHITFVALLSATVRSHEVATLVGISVAQLYRKGDDILP